MDASTTTTSPASPRVGCVYATNIKPREWTEDGSHDIIEFRNPMPWTRSTVVDCTVTFHVGDTTCDSPPGTLFFFHDRWGYNGRRITVILPKPLGDTVLIHGTEIAPRPRPFDWSVNLNHCSLRISLSYDRKEITFERIDEC